MDGGLNDSISIEVGNTSAESSGRHIECREGRLEMAFANGFSC